MWQVFLSHNTADKEFVRKLALDLKANGVTVWFDEWEMQVGDSLRVKIQEGIKGSGYFAVVLSPDSVQSKWVEVELNAGLEREMRERAVFVLPILYKDCDIPPLLQDKIYADFTYDYDRGLQLLLQRLKNVSYGGLSATKLFGTDITELQAIIEDCAFNLRVGLTIMDASGSTLTSKSIPLAPYYNTIRMLEDESAGIYSSDWAAFRQVEKNEAPLLYESHMGLLDFCFPIMVDSKVHGVIFTGQKRIRDIDESTKTKLHQLEKNANLPRNTLVSSLQKVPITNSAEINMITKYVNKAAKEISKVISMNKKEPKKYEQNGKSKYSESSTQLPLKKRKDYKNRRQ
jgi:ligand-binding sensor protein